MKVKHLKDKTTIELTASELQDWIKKANSKGLDGQKLYDTAKSLIAKYEKTL